MTVIIFILVLAILIFVHELGHFLLARACGIRVDAFALGFGPKLISKKYGETLYSLNLIPFGGYVKIFGENPDDESMNGEDKARSFINQNRFKQILVLVAGIVFNFIFAFLIVIFAFAYGVPASVESYPGYEKYTSDEHIAITFINKGSPAEKAGLKAGDRLIVESVEKFQNEINDSKNNGIDIKYIRNENEDKVNIVAQQGIVEDKYAIGIGMDNVAKLKLPIGYAIVESMRYTLHTITLTIQGVYDLVIGIFDGSSKMSAVTGPVGIAGMVGDAAKLGITYLIMFTAMISINLGVLNLVPFPALDGGRIFVVLIESIIRRPIKPAFVNATNAIGFGLLIILMIVVTYRDIAQLFVK